MTALLDKEQVRAAARGRWAEVFTRVCSVDTSIWDGRHHPCPKCGGTDRFRVFDDFAETGGVICNQCHAKDNQDGYATIRWLNNCTFNEAVVLVADYFGIQRANGNGLTDTPPEDAITLVARAKHIPRESLVAYGATAIIDQSVVLPAYGPDGKQCTSFTVLASGGKGKFKRGRPAGLFFPHHDDGQVRLPQPGESWHIVEGFKDAGALHGMGLLAVGLNTCHMAPKFAPLFPKVNVVIVPDRDDAGTRGAGQTAMRLRGVAATVRIATLPTEHTPTGGADVRDVLQRKEGDQLVRQAIQDAAEPDWVALAADEENDRVISNGTVEYEEDENGQEKRIVHPLMMQTILDRAKQDTDDWPRLANGSLFVIKDDLVLSANEQPEQTAAIHRRQRAAYQREFSQSRPCADLLATRHQHAQRLLEPLQVVIPWADQLTFRTDQTRHRRDHAKYLTLIAAVTLLHQYQRTQFTCTDGGQPRRCVVASLDDIELANRLACQVFCRHRDTLMPQTRQLLVQIQQYVAQRAEAEDLAASAIRFSQRQLREALELSDRALRTYLTRLVELEYVLTYRTGRGNQRLYQLLCACDDTTNQPSLSQLGLVDVTQLRS